MPTADPVVTTIDELLALPDDGLRHELLDGVHVVTPAPTKPHQVVLGELFMALRRSIGDRTDFDVLWSPADIRLGPRTLVQPDLFLVSSEGSTWRDMPLPRLVIEAVSPSTAARDRGLKRRLYLEAGVEEYWIVDLDARLVERWRVGDSRPEIVDESLDWSLTDGPSGIIDLPSLFARVTPGPAA